MKKSSSDANLYEIIAKAMFVNYESIYDIDVESSAYKTYHESEKYKGLRIKSSGDDFFASLKDHIPKIICPDDAEYVFRMLKRDTLIKNIRKDDHYSFFYRVRRDGKDVYHQIRAVIQPIDGKEHILLGVCDVDEVIRREMEHRKEIEAMHQKERNHLEAVLASAAGYLEANLSKNTIIETSLSFAFFKDAAAEDTEAVYSDFVKWFDENYVASGRDRYNKISNRDYLISCYEKGEKRASVYFDSNTPTGEKQPCRIVFFLYKEKSTGDIYVFCVLYDLTEQQKKELELEQLENELRLSRLRNFTGQMQPHFLYNALGSIQEIVLDDPEYASLLLGDFSTHLRSCIKAMTDDDTVPFSHELENIKAYTNIEKMRFGDKLNIVYEIETEDFNVLPLSIQPVVENAIRHGIYERGVKGGTVVVRTRESKDFWIVEVEDDGVGFNAEAFLKGKTKTDSFGLRNIIFRMDKVMNANVDIESTAGIGTKVTVSVPKGGRGNEDNNS